MLLFVSALLLTQSLSEFPWWELPLDKLSCIFTLSSFVWNAAKSASSTPFSTLLEGPCWLLFASQDWRDFSLLSWPVNQSRDSPLPLPCPKAEPKSAKLAKSPKSDSSSPSSVSCSFLPFWTLPPNFDFSVNFSSLDRVFFTGDATGFSPYFFDLFTSFRKTISLSSSSNVSSRGGGASARTVEKFDPYRSELFTP